MNVSELVIKDSLHKLVESFLTRNSSLFKGASIQKRWFSSNSNEYMFVISFPGDISKEHYAAIQKEFGNYAGLIYGPIDLYDNANSQWSKEVKPQISIKTTLITDEIKRKEQYQMIAITSFCIMIVSILFILHHIHDQYESPSFALEMYSSILLEVLFNNNTTPNSITPEDVNRILNR